MLPFCGYHMADYFNHWLDIGRVLANPPRVFHVNWFRRSAQGEWLWPGFGENMRVLEWILSRTQGHASAVESPIGWMPRFEDLNLRGMEMGYDRFSELMAVKREEWLRESFDHEALFIRMWDRVPRDLLLQREMLISRLFRAPERWNVAEGVGP
jgi:phosphoenolpyruvate carboxykinase (GTP)